MNIKITQLYQQLERPLRRRVFNELDTLWNVCKFVPNPIPVICQKNPGLTRTQALYLIMGWQQSKLNRRSL